MKKLYDKSPLGFALVWIGLYVVVMNIALQVCGSYDELSGKTTLHLLAPEQGSFTALAEKLLGIPAASQICSAILIILLSGGYALWLWKKAKDA